MLNELYSNIVVAQQIHADKCLISRFEIKDSENVQLTILFFTLHVVTVNGFWNLIQQFLYRAQNFTSRMFAAGDSETKDLLDPNVSWQVVTKATGRYMSIYYFNLANKFYGSGKVWWTQSDVRIWPVSHLSNPIREPTDSIVRYKIELRPVWSDLIVNGRCGSKFQSEFRFGEARE